MCDILDLTDSPVPVRKANAAEAPPPPASHPIHSYNDADLSDDEDYFSAAASQTTGSAKKKSATSKKRSASADPEKQAKKDAAEAAKRVKEIEKERKRLAKEDEQRQKDARKEEMRVAAQMSGRHKDSEVSMIIEDRLYNSEEGLNIINNLRQQTNDKEKPLQFLPAPSRISNLIRWTYRSKSEGGGCNIGDPNCRVMEFLVVVMPSAQYMNLAMQTDDSVDFDALGEYADDVRRKAALMESCPSKCRLVILVNDLDKQVNEMAKSKNHGSMPGLQSALAALDGAEAYLIADQGVDLWKVKSVAEMAEYLKTVTQQLAEAIYKEPVTELECVVKKSIKPVEGFSGREKEIYELRETWINMLQTIPGISDKSARSVASYYSCPRKLLDAYHSKILSLEEKRNLLSNKFGNKGEQRKLSRKVYELMTTFDPNLMIDDVN